MSARPASECGCPFCTWIEGLIEGARQSQDVSDSVRLRIAKDSRRWPQKGARERRPERDKPGSALDRRQHLRETGKCRTRSTKERVSHPEGCRLHIVQGDSWGGDGRVV